MYFPQKFKKILKSGNTYTFLTHNTQHFLQSNEIFAVSSCSMRFLIINFTLDEDKIYMQLTQFMKTIYLLNIRLFFYYYYLLMGKCISTLVTRYRKEEKNY